MALQSKLKSLFLVLALWPSGARADNDLPRHEASVHFQRGVELYNDGDFRGALVEFKRAYAVWPRANVLYDVGQTEFQLLDYAAALKTMERYLAETGPNAAHRSEVENTVEVLRGRVGHIALLTAASECDVTLDDQPAGQTPVRQPILVSVGVHRLGLRCPGRAAVARDVEVTAGETVRVDPKLPPPTANVATVTLPSTSHTASNAPHPPSRAGMAIGWSLSALLAGATAGVGVATLVERNRLEAMKATYPVARADLDRQSSLTYGLAIAFDALAAASLVAVGVSTYLTVKFRRERKLRVGPLGAGAFVATTF